jgi:hypothetical protein
MTTTLLRRAALVAAVVAALAVPSWAAAAVETFRSFEAEAIANYVVNVACDDGSTVQQRVQVIGGHEEESENGVTTDDRDFLSVRIFGFDCEGNFFSERGQGDAEFTWSPSLQEATVTGTVTTSRDRVVTVDLSWEGTGPMETTTNTTVFPGFSGTFVRMQRDAVATGTVVVDGETLVDGSTTNASIETNEDNNRTTGQA